MTRPRAAIVSALAGFAVLTVELAAVRLFAPHFGDSAFVWTNVIGVMLIALAAGAWLGGRLAVAGREPTRLGAILAASALLTAIVPFLSGPLGQYLVPEGLALEDAGRTLVIGSLCATLIAFAPPVALAGAVTPLLVGALSRTHDPARSSGLVAGFGTLGSLVGTFLTTHLLVPELGSRITMWIAALTLALASVLTRKLAFGASSFAACALPLLFSFGPLDPPADGVRLLAEVESSYQFLQVLAHPKSASTPAQTALRINEGLDSFHSVKLDGTPWTGGCYYDYFAPLPRLLEGDARRTPRVLSLGGAAGTFDSLFRALYPGCEVHSVEIDPAVTALGRAWFGAFPHADSASAGIDARVFVDITQRQWDLVLVDAYERQVYVPAHVASEEFFARVRAITTDGGIVAVNCGGVRMDDPVLGAIAGTVAREFGEAFAFRVPASRNFVIAARNGGSLAPARLANESAGDPIMRDLCVLMGDERRWHRFAPSADPLVDDRPVLDSLFDRTSMASEGRRRPLPIGGGAASDAAAELAFDAQQHGDHEGTIAAITSARTETAYLRLMAGDALWGLHDPRAALVEYRRGLELDVDTATRDLLHSRITDLAPLLAGKDLADHSAQRARTGALLAGAALLALLGLAWRATR